MREKAHVEKAGDLVKGDLVSVASDVMQSENGQLPDSLCETVCGCCMNSGDGG